MKNLEIQREVIKSRKIQPKFLEEVIKAGGEKILLCIQCGTCTGSCPSGRRTAYRTRQVIRRALLGLEDDVLPSEDIWLCSTCYTCQERCPRGIDVTNVILVLRNLAVHAGHMLSNHRTISHNLLQTGHAVPIDEENKQRRKELGLSELPPTAHSYPWVTKEVQVIAKKKEFDKLVEFEEEETQNE